MISLLYGCATTCLVKAKEFMLVYTELNSPPKWLWSLISSFLKPFQQKLTILTFMTVAFIANLKPAPLWNDGISYNKLHLRGSETNQLWTLTFDLWASYRSCVSVQYFWSHHGGPVDVAWYSLSVDDPMFRPWVGQLGVFVWLAGGIMWRRASPYPPSPLFTSPLNFLCPDPLSGGQRSFITMPLHSW